MRKMLSVFAVVAFLALASSLPAEESKSGLQQGDFIGAFDVVKTAGNPNDGVAIGDELCYRCKLGGRPVVAVFAQKSDDNVAKLIKELDKFVTHNEDKKAAAFVNLSVRRKTPSPRPRNW